MRKHLIATVIIIAAGIAAYSNSLQGPFHFDDQHSIVRNTSIRNLNPYRVWRANNRFRFVGFYSFSLNYRFGGLDNIKRWHYVNTGLHLACSLLLYWVLFLLVQLTPAIKVTHLSGNKIPLMASILFAVHPLCSEPVNYIQARHVLFYSLFSLSGMFSAISFTRTGPRRPGKIISLVGMAASIVLGGMSKEVGIFYVPALITLCLVTSDTAFKGKNISRLVIVAIAAMMIMAIFPLYHLSTGEDITFITHFLTQVQIFWRYVSLLIPLSSRLNVDHYVEVVKVKTFGQLLLALLPLLGIGAVLAMASMTITCKARKKTKNPVFFILILWVILGIFPYMLISKNVELMVEYKIYLSAMGLMGLLALCFERTAEFLARSRAQRQTYRSAALILGITFSLLVIFCIKETRSRNQVWRTEISLWDDAVQKSPEKARPYNNRGRAYQNKGDIDRAIADYNKAIEITPNYAYAYNNRGLACQIRGDIDRSLSDYNEALRINPDLAEAYYNRGVAYQTKGDIDRSLSDYNEAIRINPDLAEAYNNRGVACVKKGHLDQAISDLTRVIKIIPDADAYYNRAMVYFLKQAYGQSWEDVHKATALGYKVQAEFLEKLKKASGKEK